ncbi:hypothetical protein CDAR_382991 [Caerostris darwini]|uniref:Uncharacterized protein n=1 Tax=Caerostris darwini TaxID=1538125 RepID=A0AAV4STV4_9ARAC|nr:hypothetical protein CDAR_382991 [Caerostris darwini]
MVESRFQKEFLELRDIDHFSVTYIECVTYPMVETDEEKNINLIMPGFGNENLSFFRKRERDLVTRIMPTATNLLITASKDEKKVCSGKHSSSYCFFCSKFISTSF